MDQTCPKRVFPIEKGKSKQHHWILNWQLIIFWTKFTEERYYQTKTEKVNTTIGFCIFQLVWFPKFTLNNFDSLGQICLKRVFPVKNRKNQHHHWTLDIHISLSSVFQRKLLILIFSIKCAQQGHYLQCKTEQVNTIIAFCILELV